MCEEGEGGGKGGSLCRLLLAPLREQGTDVCTAMIVHTFTLICPSRDIPSTMLGYQIVREGRRPLFPPDSPQAYVQLAVQCWQEEAGHRCVCVGGGYWGRGLPLGCKGTKGVRPCFTGIEEVLVGIPLFTSALHTCSSFQPV